MRRLLGLTLLLLEICLLVASPVLATSRASHLRPRPPLASDSGPASGLPEQRIQVVEQEPRYADLLSAYAERGYQAAPGDGVALSGLAFAGHQGEAFSALQSVGGRPGQVLGWEMVEPSWVEWEFDVPAAGLYTIVVDYYPLPGKRSAIQRELLIDGEYPFREAKRITFDRIWREIGEVKQDNQGNDVRPPQEEAPQWRTVALKDSEGMYREPFWFYFTRGAHTVRLVFVREPIAIAEIRLVPPQATPSYAEVAARYQAMGYRPTQGIMLIYESEDTTQTSDPTVRREPCTNPNCTPVARGNYRLNAFGGWRWRRAGQWAEWVFTIPEDGLYKIGLEMWNGWGSGMPSVRSISIDGQVPFRELEEVLVPYHKDWKMRVPGAWEGKGDPYLFYLTKGEHVLRIEATVGPVAHVIHSVEDVLLEMSTLAREIILITGANPDPNLEWRLADSIPNLVPRLTSMADTLDAQVIYLENMVGSRPGAANMLVVMARQLRTMAARPDTIPQRLKELGENQSALGFWLLDLREQPVFMDRIYIASPDVVLPVVKESLWQQIDFTIANFIASFTKDYTNIGSVYRESEAPRLIEVWVGRGLDWARIMKDMIEDDFTPRTNIFVNLHVLPASQLGGVSEGTGAQGLNVLLLSATAGEVPDVATGVNPQVPVEFAIRGALLDLNDFDDYAEVAQRFRPGALIPFHYGGGDYALPETQDFNMLFYRTDVLGKLGIEPPQTWEELYDAFFVLQQNGLEFYYPPGPSGLTPFLFQNGGRYYTDDGRASALTTPEALKAFREWTELYTNYRVPPVANFFNRFKTGEMPIGISNYWTYVLLSTAARELTGRWAMAPMPGVRRADGTIDRSSGGAGQSTVIFKSTADPEASWEFVKWWSSADVQVRFGQELEALLGVEARWNTANVEALHQLPWPRQDIEAINEQWKWFQEQPVVLGGYFTWRHVNNAWNRCVLQGWHPREALEEAVKDINRELVKKQEEFGVVGR